MPPVKVDPAKVKTFENAVSFYRWLSVHHEEDEVVHAVAVRPLDPGDQAERQRDRRRVVAA